jgi:hypothetical protein
LPATCLSTVVSAVFLASASAAVASWRQYGFNAAHTSFNDEETKLARANVSTLTFQWAGETGRNSCSPPIVGRGSVFVGAHGIISASLQKMGDELQMSKAAPQMVTND